MQPTLQDIARTRSYGGYHWPTDPAVNTQSSDGRQERTVATSTDCPEEGGDEVKSDEGDAEGSDILDFLAPFDINDLSEDAHLFLPALSAPPTIIAVERDPSHSCPRKIMCWPKNERRGSGEK